MVTPSQINAKNPPEIAPADSTEKSSAFEVGAKVSYKPVGSSGTEVFGGYFSEEYLQSLRGNRGAKIWDEMRRSEPQVAMLLSAITNPIKSATWAFEEAEDVADAEKHKELVRICLQEMVDWEAFLHEALTVVGFGFSLFEPIHNVVFDHPKLGTFNGLKAVAFRSQKTIYAWTLEKQTGKLLSVQQFAYSDVGGTADIPGEFLLVFSNLKEGDNYEGISALRPMYGPYFRKNLYHKLAAIGVERSAVGTVVGTLPPGVEDPIQTEAFKKVLSSFTSHEAAYIMKPSGFEVEIVKIDFDASNVKDLIVLENTEMINAAVANFLALGTNGGSGAFALGTDLSDFFLNGIQSYANLICGVLNRQLIPNLVKLNFGPQAAYPILKCTGINDKAGKEFSEIVSALVGSNTLTPDATLEEYLRERYKMPKADAATARQVEPTKAIVEGDNVAPLPGTSGGNTVDVQKLSLNGAQVASLLSIIQRVAAGLLPRDTGIAAMQSSFNLTPEEAGAIMGTVGSTFKPDPAALALLGQQLAEGKTASPYSQEFDASQAKLKATMQLNLKKVLAKMQSDLKKKPSGAEASALALTTNSGYEEYANVLKEALAEIATKALTNAKNESKK